MRRVLLIQARMGSSRLPGKVMMDIGGETMLARVVRRVRRAASADTVAVATTLSEKDEAVARHARELGVEAFRGDEERVLDRYYEAARFFRADAVIRITADCPLADPELVDKVAEAFEGASPPADFAANTLQRTYPHGLDVEMSSFSALKRAWEEANKPYQRAHVYPYIYEHPEKFSLVSVADGTDRSGLRWTVDTAEDLAFVREIYRRLGGDGLFSWREVLRLLEREPELSALNRGVRQKAVEEG
jgi:spore coat polysaccharide biosynthesis protein SpsF